MKRLLSISLLVLMSLCTIAQDITLTFTGRDENKRYLQLNRIVVCNITKGWQENILWPDTTLTVQNVTANKNNTENCGLDMSQNYPNPFNGTTDVNLSVEEAGNVTIEITDLNGRVLTTMTQTLQSGIHQFRVSVANTGTYLMSAIRNGGSSSVKMVCNGSGNADRIEYQGIVGAVKTQNIASQQTYNTISYGDLMEYVGYATVDGTEVEIREIAIAEGLSQAITLQAEKTQVHNAKTITTSENFRVALSLSPFSLNQFEDGYTFVVGDKTATTPEELQSIYRDLGSTEMYVRIATKRHKTAEDITDGKEDPNANVHTFDQGMRLCRIAAALDIPINPEIMCAYTYMDMDGVQAPRFDEYPDIYALQNGKKWEELTIDEICTVLEAYGEFVADSILATGCTVNNWNLGNEANFGFAGVGMGVETAVDSELGKASAMKRYMASVFSVWWLKKHVWQYNVKEFAAVKNGILNAYAKRGLDASNVKFSTHIATVVFTPRCSASYFRYMKANGYDIETAGISYYPSAPAMSLNKKKLLTKTITRINKKCNVPVFIGEFSYPSGKMQGAFAGWNKKLKGYEKDQQGQADIYSDVVKWGKTHGMAGIRYWAPDFEGWYSMAMFEFSNKKGTAKTILQNHKEIIGK